MKMVGTKERGFASLDKAFVVQVCKPGFPELAF